MKEETSAPIDLFKDSPILEVSSSSPSIAEKLSEPNIDTEKQELPKIEFKSRYRKAQSSSDNLSIEDTSKKDVTLPTKEEKKVETTTEPASSKEQSIKDIRVLMETAMKERDESRKQFEEYKSKWNEQILLEKEEEVKRLGTELEEKRKLEKEIYDWKSRVGVLSTKEVEDTIFKPLTELSNQVKEELSVNELPLEVWDEMLKLKKPMDVEAFVEENIPSKILQHALFTKWIEANALNKKLEKAQKAPETFLAETRAEQEKQTRIKLEVNQKKFVRATEDGYIEAVQYLRNQDPLDIYPELMFDNNDIEYNEKIVKPLWEVANKAALAELKDYQRLGGELNKEFVKGVYVKWGSAVAARQINRDRNRVYNLYKQEKDKVSILEDQIRKLKEAGGFSYEPSSDSNDKSQGAGFKSRYRS